MMKQCYNCKHWNNEYNDFKLTYDDMLKLNPKTIKYCVMYAKNISQDIIYDKVNCQFYEKRGD